MSERPRRPPSVEFERPEKLVELLLRERPVGNHDSLVRVPAARGTVAAMALLSQMIRTAAITGDTERMNAWFADRQGRRWAEQTMGAAIPAATSRSRRSPPAPTPAAADPAETLRQLTELHERGVVTDAELDGLRARIGA